MVLLDSLLAFALTLAALATVVTLLMEFGIRILGAKRRGQIRLFKKLLDSETVKDLLPALAAQAEKEAPQPERKSATTQRDTKTLLWNLVFGKPTTDGVDTPYWNVIKAILQNPFSGKPMAESESKQSYRGWAAAGIYRNVSLEHVLRRLLETEVVQEAREDLEAKLQAIARKYDELSSALGAEFKRNAQWWSLVVGIVLAVVMNVDGTRLLQAYLQDSDLRERIIANIPPEAIGVTAGSGDAEEKLSQQFTLINQLALPLGSGYFPHCFWLESSEARKASPDPLCRSDRSIDWSLASLGWFAKVLFTGVLIGLGAPFWYDVARRLAAVRSAFKGMPSSEERHRGADAAGSPEERDELIRRIAADTVKWRAGQADGNDGAGSVTEPQGSPG